ncbi:MAG: tRNA (guanosine(46)-N7)-methyltransferase TrmB, partial [Pseudomonadota bacterium]
MDRKRIFYGRRRGRPLRRNRQALIERLLPRLSIDPDRIPEDPCALFETPVDEAWLEIGFGGGEHLVQQAALHDRVGFIGCE